jgi:uncharacterized membrane protein HdeD (DUF308 family)
MLMSPLPDIETVGRDDVEAIARTWWLLLVVGVLSVAAGIVILEVDWTVRALANVIGIVLIVRGIFDALTPPVDGAPRSWSLASGGLSIVLGVVVLVWPTPTLHVVAILIGAWLLVTGIFEMVGAIANHRTLPLWGVTLVAGMISTVLGVWALRRPGMTIAVLIVLVGIWAIVVGTLEVIASFEVKRLPKEFDRLTARTA